MIDDTSIERHNMSGGGVDKSVLNSQQPHWEDMYIAHPDMFGKEPSYPARYAAEVFSKAGAKKILELGSGQGRDTLFFVRHGFQVYAFDYSEKGLNAIQKKADAVKGPGSVITVCHDVRQHLPFDDNSLDGCYSHMLYCMALTTPELEFLSQEVHRVLKPGGKVHLIEPYPTIWRRIADFLTFHGLPRISRTIYYRRVILTYERDMYQPWLSGCDRILAEEIAASQWSVVSRRISLFDINLTLEKPQAPSRSDPSVACG